MSDNATNSGCTFYPVAATVVWKNKTSNIITTRGFSCVTDEPQDAEILLNACAGCVAISVEEILMHRKIAFSALRTEAAGVFMAARDGIQNVRFTVYVKTEADDEMLAKIGEKVLRVSPILNSLKTTCTIRMIKE